MSAYCSKRAEKSAVTEPCGAAELMRDAAAAGDKRAEEWLRDYYFDDDAAVQAEA